MNHNSVNLGNGLNQYGSSTPIQTRGIDLLNDAQNEASPSFNTQFSGSMNHTNERLKQFKVNNDATQKYQKKMLSKSGIRNLNLNKSKNENDMSFGLYDESSSSINQGASKGSNTNGQPQSISVINYNNPTINMNFNDNQYCANPNVVNPNAYEDKEFYDSLNFSKFNKNNATASGPWTNMQTKTQSKISSTQNPYEELSKTTKNIQQAMSQQVSRQNSRTDIDALDLDEVVDGGTAKKRVVKKKIIKKIVKRKNADGTDAPPQVTTIIVEKNGSRNTVKNTEDSLPDFDNNFYANRPPPEITQTNVEILNPQPIQDATPKKIIKRIIIKRKKKQNTEQESLNDQSTLLQIQSPLLVEHKPLQIPMESYTPSPVPPSNEMIEEEQQPRVSKKKIIIKKKQNVAQQQQDQTDEDEDTQETKNIRNTQQQQQKQLQMKQKEQQQREEQAKMIQHQKQEQQPQIPKRSVSVMGKKEKQRQQQQNEQQELKHKHMQRKKQRQQSEDSEESGTDEDEEDRNDADQSSEDEEEFKQRQILMQRQQQIQEQQQQQQQQQMEQSQNNNRKMPDKGPKIMSFKVAVSDTEAYNAFVHQILFGSKARELVMSPLPFNVGMLKFTIERHRKGFSRLHPSYYLYLEKNTGGRVLVLYGKKRSFNKTSNYLISMEKNKKDRGSDICVGKLRCNSEGDRYVLYDNGENYTKVHDVPLDEIRCEHGAFIYRYEPCHVGNIRKMSIVLPIVQETQVAMKTMTNPNPAMGNQQSEVTVLTQKFWKPIREKDTMIKVFESEGVRNTNYQVLVDNPPAWNPSNINILIILIETHTYVYDFKGRVTEPSIKNFQLIPEIDGRREQTLQEFVLQFGKNGKDVFILDVQYPFSIFQAFGLALSAFDTD